jgi:PAS domain S-box-containing protein
MQEAARQEQMSPIRPETSRKLGWLSITCAAACAIGFGVLFNAQEAAKDALRKEHEDRMVAQAKEKADRLLSQAQTEATLKQHRQVAELFYLTLNRLPVPLMAVDSEGVITSWNDTCVKRFGWAVKDVVGKPLTFLMPAGKISQKHVQAFEDHTVDAWVSRSVMLDCWLRTKSGEPTRVLVEVHFAEHPPTKYLAVLNNPRQVIKIERGQIPD